MSPVIRKSETVILSEKHRQIIHAFGWQVRPGAWNPPTDLYETDDEYVVRVEIAGMRQADFEVTLENEFLVISGFRPDVLERRAYHQMEIRFGKFSTAIVLPGPIEIENSMAEYEDGFLTVRLQKARSVQVKIEE